MKSRKTKIETRIYWFILLALVIATAVATYLATHYQIQALAEFNCEFKTQQQIGYTVMSAFNALFALATITWFIGGQYIIGTWDLQFPTKIHHVNWSGKAYNSQTFSDIKIN